MKSIVAIIPARGGSKRIPNKNLQQLGSSNLLQHSIDYAKANGINHIIVTTDDAAIEKCALQEGVSVVQRPAHLATDEAPTVTALQHVLQTINKTFDTVILLQPTNPLRPKNLLKDALKQFEQGGYDSLMTVTRNSQKLGKINNGAFIPFNYTIGQRSQDLEPLYFENGLLYIAKASLILEGKIVGAYNLPFIVAHPFAKVDIDTPADLDYAGYLYQRYNE